MRLLIDTHTLIWLAESPNLLSPKVATLMADMSNTILLSHVSIWEMQIKINLGKMKFTTPLPQKIARQQASNRIVLLPVILEHIYQLDGLPRHHGDPFDRLLISQAIYEGMPILSHDSKFASYAVHVIW